MRLAVAATPHVAIPTLNYLLASQDSLVRIFTTEDKYVGRGRVITPSEVSSWADAHGVECIKVGKASDMSAYLDDIDCVVTVAFGLLLPQEIFTIPKYGFINLHFSLLPAWRGAAPVQRAIENGDEKLGVTVFSLDQGMDTGPIYTQTAFDRDSNMRSKEALEFLGEQGVPLVAQTLLDISNGVRPVEQSQDGISLARKLSKTEALIDWQLTSAVIDRKIKAFYPNPIAFTSFRGENLKITRSQMCDDLSFDFTLKPGEWLVERDRVLIGSGDTALEVVELIPQGKSEMKASDWARGARISPGELCG